MYRYQLVGNEDTEMFPFAVVDDNGNEYNRYSHRSVADQVADKLNMDHAMQTMTSRYVPGRSPFARLRRDVRRMVENLREVDQAAIAQDNHLQAGYDKGYADQFQQEQDALWRTYANATDTVARFQECLVNSYGQERAARIYWIADQFA